MACAFQDLQYPGVVLVYVKVETYHCLISTELAMLSWKLCHRLPDGSDGDWCSLEMEKDWQLQCWSSRHTIITSKELI